MFGFKIGDANSVAFYSDNQEKLKHVKSATLVEQAAALCRAKFGLKKERDAYAQQEGNIRHIQGCIAYLDKQIFGYRAAIAKAPAAIAFGQFSETQLSAVNKSLDDDLAERERLLQSLKINQDALPHVNTAVGFKSSLKTGVEVEIVNSLADRAMDTIRTKAGPDLVLLVQAVCAKTWQPGARESFESVFLRLIDPLFPNSKTPGNGIMLPNYAEGMEAITTLLDEAAMTAKPTRVVKKHGGKEFFCLEEPLLEKNPYPRYVCAARNGEGKLFLVSWDCLVDDPDNEPDQSKHLDWDRPAISAMDAPEPDKRLIDEPEFPEAA